MFTGIITDVGLLAERWTSNADKGEVSFKIHTAFDTDHIDIGASIAHSGVCLTVIEKGKQNAQDWFTVQLSEETLSRSSLGAWNIGARVNLEQAARLGDEMGGHIVSGHVDGLGELVSKTESAGSVIMRFALPNDLARFTAEKGSITIDGVSLTVNNVGPDWFEVNIIPHTQSVTTLGDLNVSDKVNLEIDMLARYVARYIDTKET